jgi:hypothetical protein
MIISDSNSIGRFTIGISPIGSVSQFGWSGVYDTIISQFINSPILVQLLENFNQYLDLTANFDAFFDLVWNVDTAEGWGLDVWGRIVGVSRVLSLSSATYFGLTGPAGDHSGESFNVAPFYSGGSATTNVKLTDKSFRILILAKALANISDGSIPSMNQLLLNLFPKRGNCYVTDGRNMTMTYTFHFDPTPVERAIISQSGVLPTPTGVLATVVFGV